MIEKTGDLFTSDAPALAHGVNVRGVMGAGIARRFRELDEGMYLKYANACADDDVHPGDVLPIYSYTTGDRSRWIYNIASQQEPGPDAKLEWLSKGLMNTVLHARSYDVDRIALPEIGCGIGGLKWEDVVPRIAAVELLSGVKFEVWHYEPQAYVQHATIQTEARWNPDYPEEKLCKCGDPYYRHFDTYEDMLPIGCKYCECWTFEAA